MQQAGGKMDGRQAMAVILGVSALVASAYSYNAYLQHKESVAIESLRTKEYVEALTRLSLANESQVQQFKALVAVLEQQRAAGNRSLQP